jgi:hypothetical protein
VWKGSPDIRRPFRFHALLVIVLLTAATLALFGLAVTVWRIRFEPKMKP